MCVLTISTIIGTQLAYVLSRFKFPGNTIVRNMFLFATLLPGIAMQIAVYQMMFKLGLINSILGYVIMMCGTDIISIYIYIQYFENISVSLDESAIVDGASYLRTLFSVKFPLLMPSFTICLFLTLSNCFKVYDVNIALTGAGPNYQSEMFSLNIYNEIFDLSNFGYGQAKAIIFFLIIAVITMIQVSITKKREVAM